MGKVDFYIVAGDGADEPLRIACRLADKAWRQGHRVRVQVTGRDALQRLDALMWTFKQDSFLPHEIDGENSGGVEMEPTPVVLGKDSGGCAPDVLINLAETIPENADQIPRIAEIVSADEESKRAGRDRFRLYRERGFELDTHEV